MAAITNDENGEITRAEFLRFNSAVKNPVCLLYGSGKFMRYVNLTPERDSNEILTQVIGLTCSGQTGRIHLADFDVWGLAKAR